MAASTTNELNQLTCSSTAGMATTTGISTSNSAASMQLPGQLATTNAPKTVHFMHREKVDGKSGPIFRRHASVVQLIRLLNHHLVRAQPLLRRQQRRQRQLNRHGTRTCAPKMPTRSTTG